MKHTIAITLALFVLLPFVSAAINVGTGAPPVEAERASSVQVFSFGENAMICVNCPALTSEPEPGLASSTLASYMPRIVCRGDTPCVIYAGLKYKEDYDPTSAVQFPYIIATKDAYKKDKPLLSSSGRNVRLEDVSRGDLIVDAENKKVYTIDMISSEESDPEGVFKNVRKLILQNAKVYINNLPVGTEAPLAGTLSEAERGRVEQIRVTEEDKGQILKIRGLDKRAPNQLIDKLSIPLKKGDTITFKGLFGDRTFGGYRLDMPVLNIGRFTDNEDDSTAEDKNAKDWLDELDNKFLDSGKDRSELKICNKKFVNYYAGSSFTLRDTLSDCKIDNYLLNTELFEEDDADDNKLFSYACGDIVFEAVGGDVKNLYCNQADMHNALLSCGKDGNDEVCTGVNGKLRMKVRIEPGAFFLNNRNSYNFRSIKEASYGEQKAYQFITNKIQILTYQQSVTPGRYDIVENPDAKPIIITYKDNAALAVNTITLPEDAVVQRKRSAQRFFYYL
ncbi:MAG: hypothetical protein QME12_04635, partial [Nanoarchaeota archaeon]|nr:hypothetical protein [Nanoarchaeota archaeon]